MVFRDWSEDAPRHFCRNPRCRAKLKTVVDNRHHAFCTPGCFASFYLRRCRVCERAVPERRQFCGRKCKGENRKFPHLFCYPVHAKPLSIENRTAGVINADEMGLETSTRGLAASASFWRNARGEGWFWEHDQGEHRLFNRNLALSARVNKRADHFAVTYPRCVGTVAQLASLEAAKRLALSLALGALPLDDDTAARVRRTNTKPHPYLVTAAP